MNNGYIVQSQKHKCQDSSPAIPALFPGSLVWAKSLEKRLQIYMHDQLIKFSIKPQTMIVGKLFTEM